LLINTQPNRRGKMLPGKTTDKEVEEDTTMTEMATTIGAVTTVIEIIATRIETRATDIKRRILEITEVNAAMKEVSDMEKVAKRSAMTVKTTIEMVEIEETTTEIKGNLRRKLSLKRSPKKKWLKRSERISRSLFLKSKMR